MISRMSITRFLVVAIVGATVGATPAALAQSPKSDALAAVEAQILQNQWVTALHVLRTSMLPAEVKLAWLEQKAEEGSPAAQFELAAMLHSRNLESSLTWYARAVLGGVLDRASCTEPIGYSTLLDRVEPVRSDGIDQPDLLERAIDTAMSSPDILKPTPWSGWLCRPTRRLTGEREAAARRDAMRDMEIETRSFKLFAESVRRGRERSYRIVDTGLSIDSNLAPNKGAWIDDAFAMFIATDENAKRRTDRDEDLFLWNAETRTYRNLMPQGFKANGVCSHRGKTTVALIRQQRSDQEIHGYELTGEGHDLHVVLRKAPWLGRTLPFYGRPGCNASESPPTGLDTINVRWLEPEHGYIESIPENPGPFAKTTLVKADGTRVFLPEVFLPGASHVRGFAPWKNAYLLQGAWDADRSTFPRRGRERGDAAVMVWLKPDGTVETQAVPYGYWDQSNPPSREYWPTRLGIVGAGRRFERDDRPGFSGLYLFEDGGRVTRLIAGLVNILDISPDGCRIALGQRQSAKTPSLALKVIEMCRGDL